MKTILLAANTSWYLYNFRRKTITKLLSEGYSVVCLSPRDDFSSCLVDELGAVHIDLSMDAGGLAYFREMKSLIQIFRILRNTNPSFVFNFTI